MARVKIDYRGIEKFGAIIREGMRGRSGPIHDMFKQWGARYLTFVRKRYIRNASGGGDWQKLAASTMKSRRGGKRRKTRSKRARTKTTTRGSAKRVQILRDTGLLLNALTLNMPGNLNTRIENGLRVGFGGPAKHGKGGKATIADIAGFHNAGNRKRGLPKRQIIVDPDPRTKSAMKRDAKRAVQQVARRSQI